MVLEYVSTRLLPRVLGIWIQRYNDEDEGRAKKKAGHRLLARFLDGEMLAPEQNISIPWDDVASQGKKKKSNKMTKICLELRYMIDRIASAGTESIVRITWLHQGEGISTHIEPGARRIFAFNCNGNDEFYCTSR